MTFEGIKDTFFAPYYLPIYPDRNPVEETIIGLGGKLVTSKKFRGDDKAELSEKQFEYWFAEYDFDKHSVHAFLTGEMYPTLVPNSKNITGFLIRVRLGNLDARDKFTRELSAVLEDVAEHAIKAYPIEKLGHIIKEILL